MRAIVDLTVDCTITDEFLLLDLAWAEVDATKPPDDRALYYPTGPSDAIQQLIRTAIATRLLSLGAVDLHEIGHNTRQLDLPL